jgi:hypothetical protein
MSGIHVTGRQVRRYMSSRKDGYSQAAAALSGCNSALQHCHLQTDHSG